MAGKDLHRRVGLGCFFVWALFALVVFPPGVSLTRVVLRHSELACIVPIAVGAVILVAGAVQLTPWKQRQLACCRDMPASGHTLPAEADTALRQGVRFGFHCNFCSANLTAILLVLGVIGLRTMAAVMAAITMERLAPTGETVARTIGVLLIGAGLLQIVRLAGHPMMHSNNFGIGRRDRSRLPHLHCLFGIVPFFIR